MPTNLSDTLVNPSRFICNTLDLPSVCCTGELSSTPKSISYSSAVDCQGLVVDTITTDPWSYTSDCKSITISSSYSTTKKEKKEDEKVKKETPKDPFPGYSYVHSKLEPERIVFNPPATVVFWKDGGKTVVKCQEGESYSPYYGFLAALGKRIFKTNSELNRVVRKHSEKSDALDDKIEKFNRKNVNFYTDCEIEKTDVQKAAEKAAKAIKKYANSMTKESKKK